MFLHGIPFALLFSQLVATPSNSSAPKTPLLVVEAASNVESDIAAALNVREHFVIAELIRRRVGIVVPSSSAEEFQTSGTPMRMPWHSPLNNWKRRGGRAGIGPNAATWMTTCCTWRCRSHLCVPKTTPPSAASMTSTTTAGRAGYCLCMAEFSHAAKITRLSHRAERLLRHPRHRARFARSRPAEAWPCSP